MLANLIRLACILFLLSGCATLANTPQQERTYANFRACTQETNSSARLTQVYPDGRFQWNLGTDGYYDSGMADCMRSKGHRIGGR